MSSAIFARGGVAVSTIEFPEADHVERNRDCVIANESSRVVVTQRTARSSVDCFFVGARHMAALTRCERDAVGM